MNETNTQPLKAIVGCALSSVEFVRDYVQLRFDGPCLTAITNPVIYIGDSYYEWGMPGYRDALCDLINVTVQKASVVKDKEIRLEFDDGAKVLISLRTEDYLGPEAAIFHNTPDELWVW